MKQNVTKFDLESIFKTLDEMDYPTPEGGIRPTASNRVELNELFNRNAKFDALFEDYYDVNSQDDLEAAQSEREEEIAQAKLARIEKIVDLDAKSPEDLLPSYAGKIIIECPQCMQKFYKNPADIEKSDADPTICNVGEVCQHCGNDSGYTIVGKVAPVDDEDIASASNEEPQEETPQEEDQEVNETEPEAEENNEEQPAEEENNSDLDLDLDLNLADLGNENNEEEKKEESLEASNSTPLNESTEDCKDGNCDAKDEKNLTNESLADGHADSHETKIIDQLLGILADDYAIDTDKLAELAKRAGMTEKEVQAFIYGNIEESLNNSEAQKEAEKKSELATENTSENKTLNEANKFGRPDEDDYYAQDVNDAVMELKKKGKAEFWCRVDGKKKADEVVKLFKDRYGKDAEYTIEDDYCTAKVVESLNEAKTGKIEVVYTDGHTEYITEEEKDSLIAELEDFARTDVKMISRIADNGDLISTIWTEEEGLFEESLNKAKIDKNTIPEKSTENRSVNEAKKLPSEAELKQLFADKTFNTPVSDDEIKAIIAEESLEEQPTEKQVEEPTEEPIEITNIFDDVDDIEENSFEECLQESLKAVYENIKSFTLVGCDLNKAAKSSLVLEGLIVFKSGNTKETKYTFTEAKKANNKYSLHGTNADLGSGSKFILEGNIANNMLNADALKYSYNINTNLIEGYITKK